MKEINEMTKNELGRKLTWVKKQIYKFRKGEALAYEYEDFNSLLGWKDMGYEYINEFKSRGLSKTDNIRINAFLNEYFKADNMMEKKLGLGRYQY